MVGDPSAGVASREGGVHPGWRGRCAGRLPSSVVLLDLMGGRVINCCSRNGLPPVRMDWPSGFGLGFCFRSAEVRSVGRASRHFRFESKQLSSLSHTPMGRMNGGRSRRWVDFGSGQWDVRLIVDGPHAAGIEAPPASTGRLHLCPGVQA